MRRVSPPSWEGGGGSGEEGSGETTTFLPHLHTHQPSKHHLSSSDVITASLQQHQGSDKQTKIDNDDEKENSPLSTPLVKGLCVCSSKVNRKNHLKKWLVFLNKKDETLHIHVFNVDLPKFRIILKNDI